MPSDEHLEIFSNLGSSFGSYCIFIIRFTIFTNRRRTRDYGLLEMSWQSHRRNIHFFQEFSFGFMFTILCLQSMLWIQLFKYLFITAHVQNWTRKQVLACLTLIKRTKYLLLKIIRIRFQTRLDSYTFDINFTYMMICSTFGDFTFSVEIVQQKSRLCKHIINKLDLYWLDLYTWTSYLSTF